MSLNRMLEAVASLYQWHWEDDGGGFWLLYGPQNDTQFSVELNEGEVWTRSCNALVLAREVP